MPLYIKYRLNGAGPKVKLRVLEKQSGLIGARLAGAEWSTSDIIVFLGTVHILRSHFEGKGGAQCVELDLRWRFCGHGSACPAIYLYLKF